MKIKVYGKNAAKSGDRALLAMTEMLIHMEKINSQGLKDAYKYINDKLRSVIGTNNLISLALNTETKEVYIFEYPQVAGKEDCYETKSDERGHRYIEVLYGE